MIKDGLDRLEGMLKWLDDKKYTDSEAILERKFWLSTDLLPFVNKGVSKLIFEPTNHGDVDQVTHFYDATTGVCSKKKYSLAHVVEPVRK